MADPAVKPEIKVDPAASTPQTMDDVKEFEETYDLDIPAAPHEGGGQAWLVKLPKYLWQQWADIYRNSADDHPIEIGKMRVKNSPDANQDPLQRQIQIRLATGVPQHRGLPINYDLKLKSNGYNGTVVFSEKEDPAHNSNKSKSHSGKPASIQSKNERYGQQNKGRFAANSYRTSIPKKTALAPVIHHVADASPADDEFTKRFTRKEYLRMIKPKRQTVIDDKIHLTMHPAGRSNLGAFNAFAMSSKPTSKKKAPKEKAVRIPQSELLDALDKCFRRYKYWSLKALRNELKQPEAYIKQTLEQIAVLVRSGDFAMNYMLKPEYTAEHEIKEEDVKQEHKDVETDEDGPSGTGTGTGEESEDDEGFEDIKMED